MMHRNKLIVVDRMALPEDCQYKSFLPRKPHSGHLKVLMGTLSMPVSVEEEHNHQ